MHISGALDLRWPCLFTSIFLFVTSDECFHLTHPFFIFLYVWMFVPVCVACGVVVAAAAAGRCRSLCSCLAQLSVVELPLAFARMLRSFKPLL